MSSDSKNYFGFLVDEISERGHIKTIRLKPDSETCTSRIPTESLHLNLLKVFYISLEMSIDP